VIATDVGTLVVSGPFIVAAPIAVAAGTLSFFSPCCLPLVPGYVSYVSGLSGASAGTVEDRQPSWWLARMPLVGTLLFVLGFAAVFTSYGAAFGGFGFVLTEHRTGLAQIFGGITILLGLLFLGVVGRLPGLRFANRTFRPQFRPAVGLAGAPVLGVLFGIGWTPCIGPTLAAVLLLSSTAGSADRGAALAFLYALGLGVPFLLVACAFGRTMRAVAFARRHAAAVMRTGGVLLISVGVLQVTGAWSDLIAQTQGLIGGTTLPL
jgi:cytochrome c-type biogenesis protein